MRYISILNQRLCSVKLRGKFCVRSKVHFKEKQNSLKFSIRLPKTDAIQTKSLILLLLSAKSNVLKLIILKSR